MDYNKVCWNCRGKDLEAMGDHVKCRKCGATYNDPPRLGLTTFAFEPFGGKNPPARGQKALRRPSKYEERKAARAREQDKV